MNLEEELQKHGRSVSDITSIYHGLCDCCRCGCKGKYFKAGSPGFKRAINKILQHDFEPLIEGTLVWSPANRCYYKTTGILANDNYFDIPYNAVNDKCYCLYFD